jgi:hypothetical protein
LILELNGGMLSASHSSCFSLRKEPLVLTNEGAAGPVLVCTWWWEEKSYPSWELNPVNQLLYCLCLCSLPLVWAIPASHTFRFHKTQILRQTALQTSEDTGQKFVHKHCPILFIAFTPIYTQHLMAMGLPVTRYTH